MENQRSFNNNNDNDNDNDDDNESSSNVFPELKMCCLEVLSLVQNPNHKNSQSPSLSKLILILRSSPPNSLQPLFDYTLFPLLLLLDAAVNCRSSKKRSSDESRVVPSNKVSDAVAEEMLQCLAELLSKCRISSLNQMTVLLKKLTYGAMLSPSEAAEEFRGGVVRCFRTLLLNLTTCSDTSCSCRHSSVQPLLMDVREYEVIATKQLELQSRPTECMIAFLQSESASAAVGHLLSLMLNIADAECARGLRGSAKLRIEALLSLRVLIAKVGTPDALAFFLPGVVSQLVKVLHVSNSMISGAAGSTEATEHAIRGLAEFLIIVLQDDANICDPHVPASRLPGFIPPDTESAQSFLEELRQLPVKADIPCHIPSSDLCEKGDAKEDLREKRHLDVGVGPLHVKRTPDWIEKASANVDQLLSKTFPHLCVHPSKRVRRGVLSAIRGLLLKCSSILKGSRLMLLECLCTLVCDDSEEVSAAAQDFLGFLFTSSGIDTVDDDVAEIFNRLLEKLPKMVLGSEEAMALASAKQMLAVIYYFGPRVVVDHILRSPIKAAKLFDALSLCLSQESVFAGSLGKLVLSKPSPVGLLHSLTELRVGTESFSCENPGVKTPISGLSNMATLVKDTQFPTGDAYKDYEIPHMPPWFVQVGSYKLYQSIAGVLRLVGRSLIADCRSETILAQTLEIPLGHLRVLISEIRMKECSNDSWESWCIRTHSGQLLRQAGTAACIVNEMLYGMSDQAISSLRELFHESVAKVREKQQSDPCGFDRPCLTLEKSLWEVAQTQSLRQHIFDCVGVILHEYITPEVWDIPVELQKSLQSDWTAKSTNKHFLKDAIMLHQVLIDGIGIFNLCLGKDFASSGYLCSSLYLLLENLIYSNSQVSYAADAVLRVISATSGFMSVGDLVLANSDYVIDSLCQQLRHLDLNPHVPNVLSAMLSYVGVAHKILPLLEEPMRRVSLELEILGRHQHPELTIPFLKAVAEIAKAAKQEANGLPIVAETFSVDVLAKVSDVKKKLESDSIFAELDDGALCQGNIDMEEWESILFKLNDNKRYRRIVASNAASCLTAVTPLLASDKESVCLIALDIIEDGVMTLAKVEEAFRYEKETKEAIDEVASLCSLYHLKDILDAAEAATDENRLLPAMNKIWPFMVACIRNRIPVPVRRCAEAISNMVKLCGGNFFTRRFHNDGHHFWKLLTTSPFKRKPINNEEKTALLLPYRNTSRTLEDPVSESSNLKVQAAMLRMIADLTRDKRSSSALEVVLKKVSGLVVGIACSGVVGLREASVDALSSLSSIDPDLIWVLLADVYYSMNDKHVEQPSGFPELTQILPLPKSLKDYLYVQYGGQTFGFDIDFTSVDIVFQNLYCSS